MSWHPAALAIWLLDMAAWGIYLGAAWRLLRLLPHWRPLSTDARQLKHERDLELTRYQGGWVILLLITAFVLLVTAISNLWPPLVPGAMCGTGVLQAMGADGSQTLIYRALTLVVLFGWHVVVRIDACRPEGGLALLQGRLLLLAAPLMALGSWSLARALPALAAEVPVSCCAVVYDVAEGVLWGAGLAEGLGSSRAWLLGTLGAAAALAIWGGWQWRFAPTGGASSLTLALFLPIWLLTFFYGLKFGVAPYVYEVLGHACPWCFFLPEHRIVGFVFYGLAAVVVGECMAFVISAEIGRRHRALLGCARQRSRGAGRRVMLFSLALLISIAAPVVLWRVRFGGWID